MGKRSGSWALGLFLPLIVGCSGRSPSDLKSLPVSEARFVVRAPCSPEKANAAVVAAGGTMELELEEASTGPNSPWLLTRGRRLTEGILYFRVDVAPLPEQADASEIRVFVLPVSTETIDTVEMITKPSALAMRVVARCTAGTAGTAGGV